VRIPDSTAQQFRSILPRRPVDMDALTVLAEFGPAAWCARQGDTFRAGDGLGCTASGPSWEHAAANLRARQRERADLLARLEREHAERRARLVRVLMWLAFGLAFTIAAVAGVLEAVRQ
jgi:hypothetical protein